MPGVVRVVRFALVGCYPRANMGRMFLMDNVKVYCARQ